MDEYPKMVYVGSSGHLVNSEAEELALRPKTEPSRQAPAPVYGPTQTSEQEPEPEPETDEDDADDDDDDAEAPDAGDREPTRKPRRKAKPAGTEKPKPSRTSKRKNARVLPSPAKPLKRKPKHK